MLRSKLFSKIGLKGNSNNHSKQKNIVFHFCEKVTEYFGNLDEKILCDNKRFWSVVKPRLLYKVVTNAIIILVEDNTVVDNDKKNCNNFEQIFLQQIYKSTV